uniref:20 kDa chaperonin, chloroplastic n=1 Tax=Timspurckia oligopyrenoides TaxID=708627 RepID=A0A7S0ZES1_9RHOD|mmetsp:Transcript_2422/g.4238  ORF Transcript_2422/g.4238 Transcript_2422/m.4238 type:complete len:264 (+) Transcript_2422:85-876(+)
MDFGFIGCGVNRSLFIRLNHSNGHSICLKKSNTVNNKCTSSPVQKRRIQMQAVTDEKSEHVLNGLKLNAPFRALRNNVLVKLAEAPEQTSGGLFLTSEAKEKPNYGMVVSAGPGTYFPSGGKIPMVLEEGDTVLFGKYGGDEVVYDGEKHIIVTQDDVLCKFENGNYSVGALKPLFDRVLIKKDKGAEQTSGGLTLSTTAIEKPTSGEVTALGDGRLMENGEFEPHAFKVGNRVMYGKYAGTDVSFEGVDYILVRVTDIIATL